MNAWIGRFFCLMVCVFFCLFSAGCSDDDDDNDDNNDVGDDDDNDDDNDSAPTLSRFATYNVGLAYGFVPLAEFRRDELFDSVPQVDADALCMQEVWLDDDIQQMTDALEQKFPYVYRHNSKEEFAGLPPEDEARCDSLDQLYNCVDSNCDTSDPEGLLDCAFDNCLFQLLITILQSGLDCLECMAGNIDRPFDDIVDICTTPSPPPYSYGGSNGLLLYSAVEMTETEWLQLDFFLTVRVALHAKVQTAQGPLHLYCTHLTAPISVLPYFGDFDSYEAEQLAQIDALMQWVQDTSGTEPAVVMGDFNNGPGTMGNPAEFPANYDTLLAGGLVDPYAEQLPDQCTYCNANPLNEDDLTAPGGVIIDHVFFRNFETQDFSSQRILDEPITLSTDEGPVESRLSDHYGVKVTVETP